MKRRIILLGSALFVLASGRLVGAASFDCMKAATKSEKLICSTPVLSALDEQLAEIYRAVQKKANDKEGLTKEQQNWIKTQRNACQDAACMARVCEMRIAALESVVHQGMREVLSEAESHFTFRGKPINPLALRQMFPWMSDNLPGAVAVDVEGTSADTNQYSAIVTKSQNGVVSAEWRNESGEKASFSYKKLGRLEMTEGEGPHVIQTWANDGGSGIFSDMLLVGFRLDSEYTGTGALRERLVMTRVGSISLGDRNDALVAIQGDRIVIGKGQNSGPTRVIPIR